MKIYIYICIKIYIYALYILAKVEQLWVNPIHLVLDL